MAICRHMVLTSRPAKPQYHGPAIQNVTIAMLDDWLAHGSKPSYRTHNAVIAGDPVRVSYLVEKKHAASMRAIRRAIPPLTNAVRIKSADMVAYLVRAQCRCGSARWRWLDAAHDRSVDR